MKKFLSIFFILFFTSATIQAGAVEQKKFDDNLSQEDREKKLDTLTWYNWEEPKDHKTQYEKANAEIYILKNEYYLKGSKDINQYSWWVYGHENKEDDVVIFGDGYTAYAEYKNEGYVTIEDWKEVKPKELITEMRNIQKEWAEDLKKQGANYVESIEWIYEPDFNEQDNFVNYSYEVFWNGKNGKYKTMQTNSIVLGRKGYIELNFIKTISSNTTNTEMKEFANFAKEFTIDVIYKDGSKHADYKSGDKIAAVGIGGLVAGTLGVKVLAKAGILAKFLPLLAKFWWIIIAPIVAIFGFAGKKNSSEVSGADKESISRRKKRRK